MFYSGSDVLSFAVARKNYYTFLLRWITTKPQGRSNVCLYESDNAWVKVGQEDWREQVKIFHEPRMFACLHTERKSALKFLILSLLVASTTRYLCAVYLFSPVLSSWNLLSNAIKMFYRNGSRSILGTNERQEERNFIDFVFTFILTIFSFMMKA